MIMSRSVRRSLVLATLLLWWPAWIAAAGESRKKQPPAKPLDLNAATAEQLQQLPGIGPTTAKAIVRFREKSGPFRRVEELLAIRGITKRKLEKLRPYLTVAPRPRTKSRQRPLNGNLAIVSRR